MTEWLDRCHIGNVTEVLKRMAKAGVQVNTVVTSPPYFGLRDYGTDPVDWPAVAYAPMPGLRNLRIPAMRCSLGLEPTVEAFVGHIVYVFRLVRPVLRDDATLWINMGDSYAGSRRGGSVSDSSTLEGKQPEHARHAHQAFTEQHKAQSADAMRTMTSSRRRDDEQIPRSDLAMRGLKPKDMVAQPWRVGLALQADGWWLRQDVIWKKPNPMPESQKDRLTRAHEYILLLAKSARYFFDHEAIKEPASWDSSARYARGRSEDHKHAQVELVPGNKPQTIANGFGHMLKKPVAGWANGEGDHSVLAHNQVDETRQGKLLRLPGNVNPPKGQAAYEAGDEHHRTKGGLLAYAQKVRAAAALQEGAYGDGKSERLGRESGWREDDAGTEMAAKRDVWTVPTQSYKGAHFATYPEKLIEPCVLAGCPAGGTVLDPFFGSGTTGAVAARLDRHFIGIELNPKYEGLQEERTGPAIAQPSLPMEAA